jgi:hypothetical protein
LIINKENKMKKLITLFALTMLASSAAIAGVALSGSASVSYDDDGSGSGSTTSYDADLTIIGTAGDSNLTASYDMGGTSLVATAIDLSTKIGPITVSADMHQTDESNLDDGDGDLKADVDDTGVAVSLAIPVGDATISLDNSGDITVSGTFSGVTISYAVDDDEFTGSASIAGMDVSITNDGGDTSWSVGTTISDITLTLNSDNDISAAVGLVGNTMTVSHIGARTAVAETTTHYSKAASDAYTTATLSRSLTSGASLSATYSTADDSLTLKASVAF